MVVRKDPLGKEPYRNSLGNFSDFSGLTPGSKARSERQVRLQVPELRLEVLVSIYLPY